MRSINIVSVKKWNIWKSRHPTFSIKINIRKRFPILDLFTFNVYWGTLTTAHLYFLDIFVNKAELTAMNSMVIYSVVHPLNIVYNLKSPGRGRGRWIVNYQYRESKYLVLLCSKKNSMNDKMFEISLVTSSYSEFTVSLKLARRWLFLLRSKYDVVFRVFYVALIIN